MKPEADLIAYRRALGCFATGVAVITAVANEKPVGITVNSLASVSLKPPIILWSIDEQATYFDEFSNCEHFAVHILAAEQQELADLFSTKDANKFYKHGHQKDERGLPVLDGCLARFECALESTHKAGDHNIILGRVLGYDSMSGKMSGKMSDKVSGKMANAAPLLFAGGTYRTLGDKLASKA